MEYLRLLWSDPHEIEYAVRSAMYVEYVLCFHDSVFSWST